MQTRKREGRAALPAAAAWRGWACAFAVVALLIFSAALVGVFTRSLGSLALLWPANALLLGLFVRFPALAGLPGWLGATAGYLAADLLSGSAAASSALLSATNLASVLCGYLVLRRLPQDQQRLRTPSAMLLMVAAILLSSFTAGCLGAGVNPLLFGGDALSGWTFWFTGEMVNYIAFLPVVLSLPQRGANTAERRQRPAVPAQGAGSPPLLPVLALLFSCLLAMAVGGPGAVAFPVPALLWCAVSFGVFGTAWLTLLFSAWALGAIGLGYLAFGSAEADSSQVLLSVRIGVSLIALAPLTVSSVMAARDALLAQLQFLAAHDMLSGLLNRGAFYDRGERLLRALARERRAVAVLMLDIDRFKRINDGHGHAAGDKVLAEFAGIAMACLRDEDALGRVGGEEFAAVLPGCSREEGLAVAERIRARFAETVLDIGGGQRLAATVSIGAAFEHRAAVGLDALLLAADQALYRAKEAGRNRVEAREVQAPPAAAAPVA